MMTNAGWRNHLLMLLGSGNVHMSFDDAVRDFPLDRINDFPPNVPYSPWHLLEHMRRDQRDILDDIEQSADPKRTLTDDVWPAPGETADKHAWNETIRQFREDLTSLENLLSDESTDPGATVPGNDQHTILRLVISVANHNHYHIGEFAILHQVMGTWPGTERTRDTP